MGVSREAGCKTRVVSFWLFGFCFSLMIWALGFFLDSCWFWLRFSLWNLLLSVASVCSLLFFLWFFLVWFLCSLSYCSVGLSTCVPYIAFSCPGCPSRPKISVATLVAPDIFWIVIDCGPWPMGRPNNPYIRYRLIRDGPSDSISTATLSWSGNEHGPMVHGHAGSP